MKRPGYWRREALDGYLFILPWLIGLAVFTLGPIIASMVISLHRWPLLKEPSFVGVQNYIKLIYDPLFHQSLKVTFIYAFVSVPLNLGVALGLALLLNQKVRGLSMFRTLFYLPSILPMVAVSVVWMWLYNPKFGLINYFLRKIVGLFGVEFQGLEWLASPRWALPALILMNVWGVGGSMLILLAGLQNIPRTYYDAAAVDGANAWQKFVKITLPMLSPTLFFLLVVGLIGAMQVFTQSYIMTGGGPLNATLFTVLLLYNHGFRWFSMGYASAIAWVLSVIIMILTAIMLYTSKKWVYYEARR